MADLDERIRHPESRAKVMTAAETAGLFRDGMLVATSGSMMGFPKATFGALAEQVRTQGGLKIDLMCAGPLSSEFEDVLFEAGAIRRRIGAIGGEKLRGGINRGEVTFFEGKGSQLPLQVKRGWFGTLDMAVIEGMPPGRGTVTTRIVDRERRGEVYRLLEERLRRGERAYIVYPLREASAEGDLRDATTSFEVLRSGSLGRYGVGLLTGAMKPAEKLETAGRFVSGEISVLVSTTVIEVGIDVPEATVIIVSHADRFGRSQLHQLRGRVGRGGRDSWCFLMRDPDCGRDALARLSMLEESSDGFAIAARDLELRGPGEIAGTRQHGLPSFRIASLSDDADLVEQAALLAGSRPPTPVLRGEYERRFGSTAPPGV